MARKREQRVVTAPFDVVDYLTTPEDVAEYLAAVQEVGDPVALALAEEYAAEARRRYGLGQA